ncbi:MAG: phage holin family protein [Chthoniobacterales bacterium]|nr:phage holin family protein [Chthoniobacterales bacterium]
MKHPEYFPSSVSWLNFFQRCLILSLAMLGAVLLKRGFTYDSITTLLEAALLFGFLSRVCYTLVITTQVKLFVERIGFFNVFLNAGLLYLVAKILPSFQVDRFSTAFWGAILINLINWGVSAISFFSPALVKKETPAVKQARAKVIGTRSINSSNEEKKV